MNTSMSVSLSKINSLELDNADQLVTTLESKPFSEDLGFGFRGVSLSGSYVRATLVRRTSTFVSQMNNATGQLEEIPFFLFSRIPFGVDFERTTLDVFSAASDASKVRSSLREVLPAKTRIASIDWIPAWVVAKLEAGAAKFSVENLTVNNFKHRDGIVGKYTMTVASATLATDIISAYSRDVVKATLRVYASPVGSFELSVSIGGHMRLSADETHLFTVFSYLKSLLVTE